MNWHAPATSGPAKMPEAKKSPEERPASRVAAAAWPLLAAPVAALFAVLVTPGLAAAQDHAQHPCGNPFRNHFGPFDYRSADADTKALVERVHFTPGVEAMTRPSTTMHHDMAGDVAYTLGVFPNHHRALLTMQRLSERRKSDPPPGTQRTVECWYDRAVRYTPDDTVVRALFARYLFKQNRRADALWQLDAAAKFAKDNPLSHFNIGLVYFEMGEFDLALAQAHKVQALGYDRPELEDLLKRANKWRDPGNGKP